AGGYAIWKGASRRPLRLGLQRQVPRWDRTMSPRKRFFLWGLLLGSGLTTVIPYSGLVLLVGAQATVGPMLGLVSGAVYGLARELPSVIPVQRGWKAEQTMRLLPDFRPFARRANSVAVIGFASLLLVATIR